MYDNRMQLWAKKSLGQHFLNSNHVLSQIIEAGNIKKGDKILEIGPGTGILTQALLQSGANVIAVEKDKRAIELLKEKFDLETKEGRLKIIYADILENEVNGVKDEKLETKSFIPNEPYSIIANIPYYITGAILEKFLEKGPRPTKMVLLVQKEVAERIVARDQKESVLSVSVKSFGKPSIVAKVPRGAFTPPPSVDSAILMIEDISNKHFIDKNVDISHFFQIVKAGFAHKRKYVIRNLETKMKKDDLEKIWSELGLNLKIRAEEIAPFSWFDIAKK